MNNKIRKGLTAIYKNTTASTIMPGSVILLGRRPGVTVNPIYSGESGVLDISGSEFCFAVPALTGNLPQGTGVFVPTSNVCSTGADFSYSEGSGKTQIGRLTSPASAGSVKIYVSVYPEEGKYVSGGGGGGITVDEEMSTTSTNPVQNKVITAALQEKADLDDLNGYATTGALSAHTGNSAIHVPSTEGVTNGYVLKKTAEGAAWGEDQGGEANVIETVKVDNVALPVSNKAVNIDLSGKANTADLAEVATSGDYDDLSNKPTIPAAANNAVLTLTQGGVTKGTFSADASANVTIDLDAGGSEADKITTTANTLSVAPNTSYVWNPTGSSIQLNASDWNLQKDQTAHIFATFPAGSTVTIAQTISVGDSITGGKTYEIFINSLSGVLRLVRREITPPRDGSSIEKAWWFYSDKDNNNSNYSLENDNRGLRFLQTNRYVKFKSNGGTITYGETSGDLYVYNAEGTQVARLNDAASYAMTSGAIYYIRQTAANSLNIFSVAPNAEI